MATLTIRNLDEEIKRKLRLRAARHNRSVEAEVRAILSETANAQEGKRDLADAIHARFAGLGVESLPIPPRQAVRTPPDFGAEG